MEVVQVLAVDEEVEHVVALAADLRCCARVDSRGAVALVVSLGVRARGGGVDASTAPLAHDSSGGGARAAPTPRVKLHGASRSLDSVQTASNSKKRPPTAIIPGHESPRRRETAGPPRGAEIRRPIPARFFHGLWHIANAFSASLLLAALDPVERSPSD